MTEKSTFHSRERGGIPAKKTPSFPQKEPRHSRESGNPFGAINFGIPAHFSRKLILESPRIFFAKNEVNAGICRQKWIPAFAGMTR